VIEVVIFIWAAFIGGTALLFFFFIIMVLISKRGFFQKCWAMMASFLSGTYIFPDQVKT